MAPSSNDSVSVPRLLAAGQKGEKLNVVPFYGPCHAANVPGKGRGLVASANVAANGLLLLEPALASGNSAEDLASNLVGLVEADGGDATLLRQLLSLSRWGDAPSAVPEAPEASSTEADDFMKRKLPCRDTGDYETAKATVPQVASESDDCKSAEWPVPLLRCLELACRANAFRSSTDALGSFAWHTLTSAEQRAIAENKPSRMPSSKVWLFLQASLLNHSESPNAVWLVAGETMVVRASRPLNKGEEVVISYWPDIDAIDALSNGLPDGYGMTASSLGPVPELELSNEQLERLATLKRLPLVVAERLGAAGAKGDIATLFDEVSSELCNALNDAESNLPKGLKAFLEPRFFQAQLTLQQAAILTARGDPERGAKLRTLAVVRFRCALRQCQTPWGKRVLLRLLFSLKGFLRPAPACALAAACAKNGKEVADATDFSIGLLKQAAVTVEELRLDLGRATEDVFGDEALLPALLSICGVAEQE